MEKIDIIDIIGLTGSVLVGICFIPQTYKIINSNEIKDISKLFMLLNIISASLMVVYGSYYLILPVIIANGSVLINCCIITICIIKNQN
tara:strand:+ start:417 stop:683 length:267 start_codon:yes stop_codon:yes gene_type:complete